MSDERKPPALNVTERPPTGDADIYSAETKVGKAPEDLMALVRAAEEAASSKPDPERSISEDESTRLATIELTPEARGELSDDDEVTRLAKIDVPAAVAEALHGSSKTPSPPKPIPVLWDGVDEEASVERPPPVRAQAATTMARGGLPPALSIMLIFAAAVIVMAALVR